MPIFDSDETTVYEISKLYESDGTADHQIGKVYDDNGTTNYLIYNAEELIYTNGVQNYTLSKTESGSGSSELTFNTDNFYIRAAGAYGTGGRSISALTTDKIDVTNYNTLHIKCKGKASAYDSGNNFCAVLTTFLGSNPFIDTSYKMDLSGSDSSTVREVVLDISSVTGSYHIGVAVASYQLYDASNSGYVYQIWLD